MGKWRDRAKRGSYQPEGNPIDPLEPCNVGTPDLSVPTAASGRIPNGEAGSRPGLGSFPGLDCSAVIAGLEAMRQDLAQVKSSIVATVRPALPPSNWAQRISAGAAVGTLLIASLVFNKPFIIEAVRVWAGETTDRHSVPPPAPDAEVKPEHPSVPDRKPLAAPQAPSVKKPASEVYLPRPRPNPVQPKSYPLSRSGNSLSDTYRKWLAEVALIISPAERAQFDVLTSDEDRAAFVNRFWKSHDREEHYKRLAFADSAFQTRRIPGSQTSRGRIYIMFGAPNSRVSDKDAGGLAPMPSADGDEASPIPVEIWHYRRINNLGNDIRFEFVDQANNGEFVLQAPWQHLLAHASR